MNTSLIKVILLCLFNLFYANLNAQEIPADFDYPNTRETGKTIADLIPKKWNCLDSASGDLNKDGIRDIVLVLESDSCFYSEDSMQKECPRLLLVYLWNNKKKAYEKKVENNSFIPSHEDNMMEEPFGGITIDNGVLETRFILFYSMGSWWVTNLLYKFRFQNGDFRLIGYDSDAFHRASHATEKYSVNFLSKKYSITKGNDSEDGAEEKTEWHTLKNNEVISLNSISELHIDIE